MEAIKKMNLFYLMLGRKLAIIAAQKLEF